MRMQVLLPVNGYTKQFVPKPKYTNGVVCYKAGYIYSGRTIYNGGEKDI